MKTCLTCKLIKPFDMYYHRSGARAHELQADCIECSKVASNKHKRFITKLVKRWKLKKGCAKCDFKAEHSVQLELDHIKPRGKAKHRQAVNTSWSKSRLKKELNLCQVLCANCHRLKTYNDGTMFGGHQEL
jgi:hypothetical protein